MSEGFAREALILNFMTDIRNLEAKTPVEWKNSCSIWRRR